jgi:hypothetical protein
MRDEGSESAAKLLTKDEARRIAANTTVTNVTALLATYRFGNPCTVATGGA